MTAIRRYGLGNISTGQIVKYGAILATVGILGFGIYKGISLKKLWDNLKMSFRPRIVWKSLIGDAIGGYFTMRVTAALDNPTSGHITIKKPTVRIIYGNTILAYSEESSEKISVKANSVSQCEYIFKVPYKAISGFALDAIAKFKEFYDKLNTQDETATIGLGVTVEAAVSIFGFKKTFTNYMEV